MEMLVFHVGLAAACMILFLLVYRSLKAPFFLLLAASAILLAFSSITARAPEAGSLSDLSLALSGAGTAAAALQLAYAFRLAGDRRD